MTDSERFSNLLLTPVDELHVSAGVGTLSEKYLHALLKNYFEPDRNYHEVKIGRYTADICRSGDITEIQTRSFDKLRGKLEYYLSQGFSVTVVYPIPHKKWISWVAPETGEVSAKRLSGKRGSFYDSYWELYKIKSFLSSPNLKICLMLIDVEDKKALNGYGVQRKRRAERLERTPVALADTLLIKNVCDYSYFIPDSLADTFTADDFAASAGITKNAAYSWLGILSSLGLIKLLCKAGRKNLYNIVRQKNII